MFAEKYSGDTLRFILTTITYLYYKIKLKWIMYLLV